MPATLNSLLKNPRFRLHLVTGAEATDSHAAHLIDALEEPISWVHSSDLPDPTPWLEEGQFLLTDGVQFAGSPAREVYDSYVRKLVDKGILGIGFATKIVHDEIPALLIEACVLHSMPLLEVADRTPFMAIIRHVADVISEEQRARLEWSLQAQRALARAALRPDGLAAILGELETQLRCWVALFDAVGNRVEVRTAMPIPADMVESIDRSVRAALTKGVRAGARLSTHDGNVTLQTLGQHARLRGVLAVGTATPLDPAGNDLVASVIALASIALEQSRTLDSARRNLRSGLLELLLAGSMDVAGVTAKRLWGNLPAEPVRVTVFSGSVHGQPALDELELYADEHHGRLFFAQRDGDEVVVVTHDTDTSALCTLLERYGISGGISGSGAWTDLARLLREGRRASARPTAGTPFVQFDQMYGEGMLGLLDRDGAAEVAARTLKNLTDSADGAMLIHTVRSWMEYNCAWDPAAKALGIHRHTLRNRVSAVETLLDIDLDRFADRMELWTALQFT